MEQVDTLIAVFGDHAAAEAAVKKLAASGIEMKKLSVVGKGYHTDEKVVGFYNTGDRVKFWGTRGAFWGGFWGLFFGGLFMAIPFVGHVVVLGYLATIAIAGLENAVIVGGLYVDPAIAHRVFDSSPKRAGRQKSDAGAPTLTERETEVLKLTAFGFTSKEIARKLDVGVKSIEPYKARGSEKLGLRTRAELIRYASAEGWLADI